MRFLSAGLLTSTFLLALVDCALASIATAATESAITPTNFSAQVRAFDDEQNSISVQPLSHETNDDEERVLPLGSSAELEAMVKIITNEPWWKKMLKLISTRPLARQSGAVRAQSARVMLVKPGWESIEKMDLLSTDKEYLLKFFTSRYGEDAMAEVLVDTKVSSSFAGLLFNQLLLDWKNSAKTADEVFEILKLRDDGIRVFGPKLTVLDEYITSETSISKTLVNTLATGFGGEGEIAKIIARARMDDATSAAENNLAANLQMEQLMMWKKDGKSVKDVAKLLKMKDVAKLLKMKDDWVEDLSSDKLDVLLRYSLFVMSPFDRNIPRTDVMMTDRNSAILALEGLKNPETNRVGQTLMDQLFIHWNKEKKNSDDLLNSFRPKSDETKSIRLKYDNDMLKLLSKQYMNFLERKAVSYNELITKPAPVHPS